MTHFSQKEAAESYDEKNRKLAAISDNLHFLIRLILEDLPVRSRVLCVGVGTGAEILSLAQAYPDWSFVGVDPSQAMLDVCRERLEAMGVMDRCELITGYVHDVPSGENFDAVLSVLVGHFVKRAERASFIQGMSTRLRKGGTLINAEISFDLDSPEFPSMVRNWERVQARMGVPPEKLALLPGLLRDALAVLPPAETEALIRQSGIPVPIRFFQAFMIAGWYGTKG